MDDPVSPVSSLRAVAHPLRLQMLSLLTGAAMSAAEVARELAVSHANASYHLRVLLDAGVIVEAGEEKIRGGVAKRYRHPWDLEGIGEKPTPEDRELYLRAMAEEMVRRGRLRREGTRGQLTDAQLWVAPEVWEQAKELVEQASSLLHAQARPPRTDGTVQVAMTAALVELEPGSPDDLG